MKQVSRWFIRLSAGLLLSIALIACGNTTTTITTSTPSGPDITPPTVSSTNPANNATGVALNSAITATFSEVINSTTITTAFTLSNGTAVAGSVTYNGTTATFTPSTPLASNTLHTATITNAVKDSAGNNMAANFTWTFTTGAAPDVTAPTVTAKTPASGATGVAVNTSVTATFSEAISGATLTTSSFTLSNGTSVSGSVAYNATTMTATFTPLANLVSNTTYTATVTTAVQDLAGNPLANNQTWNFTTAASGGGAGGAGTLDTTFNGTGKLTMSLGTTYDAPSAIAIQSDGKVVVAGAMGSTTRSFAVVRYNTDGTLDTNFNGTGIVNTPVLGGGYGIDLVIQPDGKIIVVGMNNNDFAVIRYNTDGSLDTTFNTTGIVYTDIAGDYDQAWGVALQPDGKIVVVGLGGSATSSHNFTVVRYNANGSLDTTFNTTGIVTMALSTNFDESIKVAIQSDGKIVVIGRTDNDNTNYDFAVVRFTSAGALDTTFNSTGIVITPIGAVGDTAMGVVIQPDGKLVIAGYAGMGATGSDITVVRYNTNGSLDTSFGTNGIVTSDFGSIYESASALALQSDGKIVVAGSLYATMSVFGVVRYNTDGTLDTSFNGTGYTAIDVLATRPDYGAAIAINPSNGKIYVAGASLQIAGDQDFSVVSINP